MNASYLLITNDTIMGDANMNTNTYFVVNPMNSNLVRLKQGKMKYCSISTCTRQQREKETNITFHRLPKNQELLAKWLENIGDKHFTVSDYKAICSRHFEDACFDRTGQTTRLRLNACPTLHLRKDDTRPIEPFFLCATDPLLRNEQPPQPPNEEDEIAHYKRGVQLDHSYADSFNRDYKNLFIKSNEQLQTALNRIKFLNKNIRRQKFRHQKITKFLKEMKKKPQVLEDPFEDDSSEKPILPKKVVVLL